MSRPSDGDTIHKAVRRGDLEAVRRFVEVEGVDVDCEDRWGYTPLLFATFSRDSPEILAVIRYLISKNSNVEATVSCHSGMHYLHGCTPLMAAADRGNLEAVKILLEEGHANVNYSSPWTSFTALTSATKKECSLHIVLTLLQHRADTNPFCKPGFSPPLSQVCCFEDVSKIVQQLVEYGADVEAEDSDGRTAMHFAASSSDEATIRLLVAHGANVNHSTPMITSTTDETPLLTAAHYSKHALVLQTLLEHNAKVDMLSADGNTVLHLARTVETLGVLLEYCRDNMTEDGFRSFLLIPNKCGDVALRCVKTVDKAKLLIEQPRRQDGQLPSVCEAQLVQHPFEIPARFDTALVAYLGTFKFLTLAVPGDSSSSHSTLNTKRAKTVVHDDCILAVKTNMALNDFQRSVADEAMDLIMDATDCTECIAHAILGHLSPLDVMKRTDKTVQLANQTTLGL